MRGRKIIAGLLSVMLVLAAVFAGNVTNVKADGMETISVTMTNDTENPYLIESYKVDDCSVVTGSTTVEVETKERGKRIISIQEGYACRITSVTINNVVYNDPQETEEWISIEVPITAGEDEQESYDIVVNSFVRTIYTIMWANDGAEVSGTDFDSPEIMLSNGSAKVKTVYDNLTDMNNISSSIEHIDEGCVDPVGRGSIALQKGNVVIFEFIPKYGYQLTSVSANGIALEPQESTNQYKYIMPETDIHFTATFSPVGDVVKSSAGAVKGSGNSITLAANEISGGSVQLSVSDVTPSNSDTFAAEQEDYAIQSIVDIDLNQVFYKGKNNDTDVWKNELQTLNENATITLALNINNMSEDIVLIHEKHDGSFETIPTTVNQNGTITFQTNSFSNYAIAMKGTGTINSPSAPTTPTTPTDTSSGSTESSSSTTNTSATNTTASTTVGTVTDVTKSAENFQGAALGETSAELLANVLTTAEQEQVAKGAVVKVWIDRRAASRSDLA